MEALFANGRIVDLILGLTALEAVALVAYHRRTGRGVSPADLLGNLLAGACLLLALRGALVGAWWGWIALCLSASLLAHLADLRSRWRANAGRRDGVSGTAVQGWRALQCRFHSHQPGRPRGVASADQQRPARSSVASRITIADS